MNVKIHDRKNIPLRGGKTGTMFVVCRKEPDQTRFEYVGSFIAPVASASIAECVKSYSEDWKAIRRDRNKCDLLYSYASTLTRKEKQDQFFI